MFLSVGKLSTELRDRLKPGFGAYFDHWLEALAEPPHRADADTGREGVLVMSLAMTFSYGAQSRYGEGGSGWGA